MRKNQIKFFVICVILLISACSTVNIAYNWADTILTYQINKFFDLTDNQDDFLELETDKLHQWHRKEELPKYVILLKSLVGKLDRGLTKSDIDWIRTEISKIRYRIVQFSVEVAATFLSSLSDQQIKHLEEYLDTLNQEQIVLMDRPTKIIVKERIEESQETIEEWTGDLTDKQKKLISKWITSSSENQKNHFEQTKLTQMFFLENLRQYNTQAEFKSFLSFWENNPNTQYSEQYKSYNNIKKKEFSNRVLKFQDLLTMNQKEHLVNKINKIINSFEDLHKS